MVVPVCFNKFFRLPICLGKNSLIVNTGRNSVSSIQFHSHKLLQTWMLKQPHSFSCPAVYQKDENALLCVMDQNVLVIWDHEADSLEGAKKIKFQEIIFAIVSVINQPVVVFNSGSCLLLEDAITKREFLTESYLKNDEKLLWVDALPCDSRLLIYLLTYAHNDGHKLHSHLLNTDTGHIEKSSEQNVSRDSVSLQSWCITSEDLYVHFLTVWSDGQVYSYNEDCRPTTHLFTVPEIQEKELLAMDALDTYHVAIIRSDSSSKSTYEIWDTRYATKKISKSIDTTLSDNLQAKILNSTLFLPSNQSIVAEPLKVESSTLAAVVGKSSNRAKMQENIIYSWTPDGKLQQEPIENETCGGTSSSIFSIVTTDEMFEELLARLHQGGAKNLSTSLKKIKYVSDSNLVKLLQYLLREKRQVFGEKTYMEKLSANNKHPARHVAKYFLKFFCISYNDIFLQQHLRGLSWKETMETLEILHLLLNTDGFCIKCGSNRHSSTCTQIVSWITLLLFSHFEEFVLFDERQTSILRDLTEVLIEKKEKCLDMTDLLRHQQKNFNFERSTRTDYCIEVLYL